MKGQERTSTESASVKTVDLIENARMTEDTIMEISIEVFQITKLLINTLMVIENKSPSKKRFKKIKTIEKKVNKLFHDAMKCRNTRYNDDIILGLAHLLIFWIYNKILKDDESINYARIFLIRCLELLEGKDMDHIISVLVLRIYSHLGIISLNFGKPEDSIPIFEKATQLYLKYIETKDMFPTFNILTIFGFEEIMRSKIWLEELYITALEKLMKAIEITFQADECILVLYKLRYLNQQLMFIPVNIGYPKFVKELLSISEYFFLRNHFTKARNCLAVARWMLGKFYFEEYQKDKADRLLNEKTMINTIYQQMNSKIARYWGRYGLALLCSSVEQLSHSIEGNESFATNNLKQELPTEFNEQFTELTLFANIGEDLKQYNLITDKYLIHYSDAKAVLAYVVYFFDEAKLYYTPDKYKIEYVTIAQDISQAYKCFAYYEQNLKKLMGLHQMRVHTLETVSKILNKRCDRNILKQIWIELGIIHSTLLNISTQAYYMYNIERTVSYLNKMATLSMENFQLYLNYA